MSRPESTMYSIRALASRAMPSGAAAAQKSVNILYGGRQIIRFEYVGLSMWV